MTAPDQLLRLLWLHRTLHEAPDRRVEAHVLDARYEEWGLERKSRVRDMQTLSSWAGKGSRPLAYDCASRTWSVTRPFDVPATLAQGLSLPEPTAQALQLSQMLLQATLGDGAQVVELVDDLVAGLPDRLRHVAIFAPPRLGWDAGPLSATWKFLHGAIGRRCRIEYRHAGREGIRRVDPHFLWWAQGGWYLLARSSRDPARIFSVALARMESVSMVLRKGRKGETEDVYPESSFDPLAWLGAGDWLYRGGKVRTARIRFDAEAVPAFRDRQWQSDACWEEEPDGTALLCLPYPARENGEWEMARRILGWGEYCTVEAPPSLVERVRATLGAVAARYH